jgi:gamma-glutamyltranspeptidase/glutathione hydrolase
MPLFASRAPSAGLALKSLILSAALAAVSLPLLAAYAFGPQGEGVASRSTLASEAGLSLLKQGGNAIDAAVGTAMALAVTYPSAGNLGGGGFAVVLLNGQEPMTLDFREIAPEHTSLTDYLLEDGSVNEAALTRQGLAVGVPGTVAGLFELHQRGGLLPWKTCLESAIRLARQGIPLTAELARQFAHHRERFLGDPGATAVFTDSGAPLPIGHLWRQKALAKTLTKIARKGPQAFYSGPMAEALVATVRKNGGHMSLEDLIRYRPVWRQPLIFSYRDVTLVTMPPPSSGGLALAQLFGMFAAFDLQSMGWHSAEHLHLMVEAEKRVYADRAEYLGDPDFCDIPMDTLMSKAYLAQRMSQFNPTQATPWQALQSDGSASTWESEETTHFSVMDRFGNAVALTTTLNWSYGCGIVVPETGVLLNNEMDDFSVLPGKPNSYGLVGNERNQLAPLKRMLSSMTPTILVKDQAPWVALGSPGGSTIITTVFQVIHHLVDFHMSLEDAIMAGRIHHQGLPEQLFYEVLALPADTRRDLQSRGHQLTPRKDPLGDVNALMRVAGGIEAVTDPRFPALPAVH